MNSENSHDNMSVSNHKGADENEHTGDTGGVDQITEVSPRPRVQYWPKKSVVSESV
jgi:hypothetical protein